MPETSQDAFETLHPGPIPITANELRQRSNSTASATTALTTTTAATRYINNPDSILMDNLNIDKRQPRKSRISFSDIDSCIGGPDTIYGYKRESSHR